MSTSFESIFSLNKAIKTDSRIMGKPTNLVYQLYYDYLQFAIACFEDDCYKDLTHIPFNQVEYEFQGDGVSNQFVLDTAPPLGCLFYVSVNDTAIDFYSYNSNTLTITINPIPINLSTIYIAGYIIGEFLSDLNTKEKTILAEACNVPWMQEKLNRNNLLEQSVYGNDFRMTSQAEHIHQLNISLDNLYWKNVKSKINEYTWKQNPNGLLGLGGGLL